MMPTVDSALRTALKTAETAEAARRDHHAAAEQIRAERDAQPAAEYDQGGGAGR